MRGLFACIPASCSLNGTHRGRGRKGPFSYRQRPKAASGRACQRQRSVTGEQGRGPSPHILLLHGRGRGQILDGAHGTAAGIDLSGAGTEIALGRHGAAHGMHGPCRLRLRPGRCGLPLLFQPLQATGLLLAGLFRSLAPAGAAAARHGHRRAARGPDQTGIPRGGGSLGGIEAAAARFLSGQLHIGETLRRHELAAVTKR